MKKSVWVSVKVEVDNSIAEDTVRTVIEDIVEIGIDSINNSDEPHKNQKIIDKIGKISIKEMNK